MFRAARSLLPVVVLFCQLAGAAEISGVDPSLVLAADRLGNGGTSVAVLGRDFTSTDTVRVGGQNLLDQRFVSASRITGRIPNLPAGFHGVELLSARGALLASLPRAVEVAPPVRLSSVSPNTLLRTGGTQVTVEGEHFRSATTIRFGTHLLGSPSLDATRTRITGIAPALAAGEPDGPYDVTAEDSRGRVVLPGGVVYEPPFALDAVEPGLVATAGGTEVAFIGSGFTSNATLKLGGLQLTGVRFINSTRMTGLSPLLAAGFHDAEITRPGIIPISRRLVRAVEAALPPLVRSVTPEEVSTQGGTAVVISGDRFREATRITFGAHAVLNPVFINAQTISGRAPPLPAGEPAGRKDVTAEDSRGSHRLAGGVNYVAPHSLSLTSVMPALISTAGGQEVTFRGEGFLAGDMALIGDQPLAGVTVVDARTLRGRAPALAAGFHDAIVERRGGPRAVLPRAVEAAPPPVIRSVSPAEAPSSGGVLLTVSGANLRRETVFQVGGRDLVDSSVSADGASAIGLAPPHDPGPKDLSAEDSRGRAVLPRALTYVDITRVVPAPLVTETALAYGTARFEWENLATYATIEVLDENDRVVDRLPGTARRYDVLSRGASSVTRKFRGVTAENIASDISAALALVHQCVVPPPLIGLTEPGDLEFTLYGGHPESGDDGCAEGAGGGIALSGFAHPINGFAHVQAQGGAGYVVGPSALLDVDPQIFKLIDRNKLTTGFTLETDADKLEIQVFARKIGVAAGLELRGRLIQVYPEGGFADEFSFPETLIKADKEWIKTVYFRRPPGGGGGVQPCLKIPAGEYLLDLYAVGGNPKLPYFQTADDPLDIELLIKGSPCPPYPMVRVTDLSGLRTVPQVECIKHQIIFYPTTIPTPSGLLKIPLTVYFHAQGTWTDFDNSIYRIHQDTKLCLPKCCSLTPIPRDCPSDCIAVTSPLKGSPDFEYTWAIYQDEEVPVSRSSGSSSTLPYVQLPDWGCYKIELTVRDKKCGLESKFAQEVAIFPESIACNEQSLKSSTCTSPPQLMKSAYFFPTPDTKNIYGVIGLKPPPGIGRFEGKRPVEVRVLVVPCHCGSSISAINNCPAVSLNEPDDANDDDVEFRLAFRPSIFSSYQPLTGAKIRVTDPCAEVTRGPKYLLVTIDDLGEIPHQPAMGQFKFRSVRLQARNRSVDPAGCWRNVGSPMRLSNRPDSLAHSFWSGHYEPGDASYHFIAKSANDVERRFDLGASAEIPLDVPGVDAAVPGHPSNDVNTGFTSRFMAIKGMWAEEDATGGMSGNTLGNDLKGEPAQVKGKKIGGGGGGGIDFPYYEWCKKQTIFKNKFSTKLFEAIIYTGTIGPVPVTVWGSIGLGLDFLIEAYANVQVAPFAPLAGGNFVEIYFDLLSEVKISIPCEVRADILAGLASIAMRLRPEATFTLIPYFSLKLPQSPNPTIDYFLQALFSLYFEIEACIQTFIFGEQCFSPGEIAIIDKANIVSPHGQKPVRPGSCNGGGAGAGELAAGEEGGGAGFFSVEAYKVAVAPVAIVSPDRKTVVDIWVEEDAGTLLQIKVNDTAVKSATIPGTSIYLIDPAAAFVSNEAVLFAWTSPALPLDPDMTPPRTDPQYLPVVNQNAATAEIYCAAMIRSGASSWALFDLPPRRAALMDTGPQPDWRADGKPSVAGDLASGEALVAWVRYDTSEFLVFDGMTTTHVPCPQGQICLCTNPLRPCKLTTQQVPNFRPQLEKTAIFARRIGFETEVVQPANQLVANTVLRSQPWKISPDGINIEPWVSTSPSGSRSYLVWLHDGTPGRKNLIDSNLGREILCSVYTKNAADLDDPAQWSAPQGALAVPDDYPGLLEPRIFLKGDDEGLLVFTALDKNAAQRDTGLGVGRYLYGSRLQGGVFGEPFRVHGKCRKRQYGYTQSVGFDFPDLLHQWVHPLDTVTNPPEWIMVFQELGLPGTREGSGNVLVSSLMPGSNTWSPPVNLTPQERVHSNVTAAVGPLGLHTIHLDGGPSTFVAGAGAGAGFGAGGGIGTGKSFVVMDTPLEPDPAINGCRLDFPYASPGSRVKATVEVENRGLVCTPVLVKTGESLVDLLLVLIDEAGGEMIVARERVPELAPGALVRLEIEVEVPLEPARLRAELLPGPVDRDLTNNRLECNFGTPKPADLECEGTIHTTYDDDENELAVPAVLLTWTNTALYDEVLIYRGGMMVAALPGACRRWLDTRVEPGTYLYEVRGRILVSKSARASCTVRIGAPPRETFRRGDTDSSGRLEITDAIALLGFLFLGTREPACPDAADADDNGRLEITDAIRILAFLFTGGPEPPAPGARSCGPDPTPDALGPCRAECR
jgi:hypothetical protein